MKTKIYISKSNRSNPDDESRVRQVLSDFDDVEVLEYRGGKSDLSLVKQSDYLIILPNLIDEYCDPKREGGLSQRQFEEFQAFEKSNYSTCTGNTMVVIESNQYHTIVKGIADFDIAESEDRHNYNYAIYDENEDSLRAILEDRLGMQVGESFYQGNQKSKSNYYHLIS